MHGFTFDKFRRLVGVIGVGASVSNGLDPKLIRRRLWNCRLVFKVPETGKENHGELRSHHHRKHKTRPHSVSQLHPRWAATSDTNCRNRTLRKIFPAARFHFWNPYVPFLTVFQSRGTWRMNIWNGLEINGSMLWTDESRRFTCTLEFCAKSVCFESTRTIPILCCHTTWLVQRRFGDDL